MSMIINTNISALNTHRNMKSVGTKQAKALVRLSNGTKINSAADDAAGLAISEKMKAIIRGTMQAERNVEDGISMIRTAEGGMNQISDMVIRQRELIIQALNDTNTDEDRAKIQKELDQLTHEIDTTAERTEFNKIPLLNVPGERVIETTPKTQEIGDIPVEIEPPADVIFAIDVSGSMGGALNFMRDTVKDFMENMPGDTNKVGFVIYSDHLTVSGEGMMYFDLNSDQDEVFDFIDKVGLLGGGDAPEAGLEAINEAIDKLAPSAAGRERHIILITDAESHTSATLPGKASYTPEEINAKMKANGIQFHALLPTHASSGARMQADILADGTGGNVNDGLNFDGWRDSGSTVSASTTSTKLDERWIQSGANGGQGTLVNRYDCRASSLGIKPIFSDPIAAANESLTRLDNSLSILNGYRATCGAQQNRLEHTKNSLGIAFTSLEDANSRIADADMAKEMMELSKSNILQQSAVAILAQANQHPQSVLQLLRT